MNLIISDLELEKQLLCFFLTNDNFAHKICDKIEDPSIFYDGKCRDIFLQMKQYYVRYSNIPTIEVMEDLFKYSNKDSEKQFEESRMFLKHIYSLSPDQTSFQYVLD